MTSVEVELIEQAGELYILLEKRGSGAQGARDAPAPTETALANACASIQQQKLTRDDLLAQTRRGQERGRAGLPVASISILPAKDQAVTPKTFTFALNRNKLRIVRRREGSYLLRSNLTRNLPLACGSTTSN